MTRFRRIKCAVFTHGGVFAVWRHVNRTRVPILTLHGVIDPGYRGEWTPLRRPYSSELLERALRILQKHYRFVSMRQALDMLSGDRPFESNAMVLTFDDGHQNQFRYALPVLRRLGVPASFYVCPGLIDRREPFWFDRLDYALQQVDLTGRVLEIGGRRIVFHGNERTSVARSYQELRSSAKQLRSDGQMTQNLAAITRSLEAESGKSLADIFESDEWSGLVTWDELREIAEDPLVEIGSHTVSHARLPFVDAETAKRELRESRLRIEQELGRPCDLFCYPSGDFDASTAALVHGAGYRCGLTGLEGLNGRGDDCSMLKRLDFPVFDDPAEILTVASGFGGFVAAVAAPLRG